MDGAGELSFVYEIECPDVPFGGGEPSMVNGGCRKDGEAMIVEGLGE